MDSTPPFSLPWAVAFWTTYIVVFYVSEAALFHPAQSARGDGPKVKQDSLAGLTLVALGAKLLALGCAWFQLAALPPVTRPWGLGVGLGLMCLGAALRQHCFRMLGPAFTLDVRATENQAVVDRGAYRYVRHPGYLAGIVMFLGFGLATTSLAAVAVMLAAALFAYIRRIAFEEAALERTLGNKYAQYAAKRKRLVPFLY